MSETANAPRNSPLWLGLGIAFAAILCNVAIFLNPPAQNLIPWLSLVLGIVALVFIAIGVTNLFTVAQSHTIGSRVLGVVVALVALLFSAGSILFFVTARHVPGSTDAPQVGQKAPDFTLPDANNQDVSLSQFFAPTMGDDVRVPPTRAVLLIFYRGYW